MNDTMALWRRLQTPPEWALKKITGGRLSGKTDINPQWRYQAMTEAFGPCGEGWRYSIDKLWLEPCASGEIVAFAQVNVSYRIAGEDRWSEPIPGIGGNMLVEQERGGMHVSDECYKMAVTDALSVALKMLGMGADVYAGQMDGSKYARHEERAAQQHIPRTDNPAAATSDNMTVTWGKKDGDYYGKSFQDIWDSGPKGHSYLHWVAEEADKMNPSTKAAARHFIDRMKAGESEATQQMPEGGYASTEMLSTFRLLYESAGLPLDWLGEQIRSMDEHGGVPVAWVKRQTELVEKKLGTAAPAADPYADVRYIPDEEIGL